MNLSRRTVTWCAAIGISLVLLYAGLTAAAWVFVRHFRHVEGVAYTDIALPTRWDRYQVIRGNHHIASGLKLLAAGKFAPGFQQLRVGLARAPRNRDGRMALAGIYAQTGRTDLAQTTLLDGLAHHSNDHDYVATTMEFLSSLAQDRKV
ncbi:MAG: tetratricopeptide repeat protein, partial [Cephaloticoccus sp.]|nr:tetratricopeptide repeat protein [Cephaloticoccus sp.]